MECELLETFFSCEFNYECMNFRIDYALTDIGDQAESLYSHVFSLKMSFIKIHKGPNKRTLHMKN